MNFNKIYDKKRIKSKEYLVSLKEKNKLIMPRYESRLPYIEVFFLSLINDISLFIGIISTIIYISLNDVLKKSNLSFTVLNLIVIALVVLMVFTHLYLIKLKFRRENILPTFWQIFGSYGMMSLITATGAIFSIAVVVMIDRNDLPYSIIPIGFILLSFALSFITSSVLAGTYKKIFILV